MKRRLLQLKLSRKPQHLSIKQNLIARISDAVADTIVEMGFDKEKVLAHLWCIVEEVPFENWGVGRTPVTPERLKEALGFKE